MDAFFTGNRKRKLFFPAAPCLTTFFCFVYGHFHDPVRAVAQTPAVGPVMVFFRAGAVTHVNGGGVGATGFAEKQKQH